MGGDIVFCTEAFGCLKSCDFNPVSERFLKMKHFLITTVCATWRFASLSVNTFELHRANTFELHGANTFELHGANVFELHGANVFELHGANTFELQGANDLLIEMTVKGDYEEALTMGSRAIWQTSQF